jgi:hypothetical protein
MTRHEGLRVLGESVVGGGAVVFASIWQAGVEHKIAGDAEHAGRR